MKSNSLFAGDLKNYWTNPAQNMLKMSEDANVISKAVAKHLNDIIKAHGCAGKLRGRKLVQSLKGER